MLRGLLSRLTGRPVPARAGGGESASSAHVRPPEAAMGGQGGDVPAVSGPAVASAHDGSNGPVFSSRAVRDATVVTGALESLKRFADGQIGVDEISLKLATLTPEQFNFLQLSAEPSLIDRTVTRAADAKGVKAGELRRLLEELAGAVRPAQYAVPSPAPPVRSPSPTAFRAPGPASVAAKPAGAVGPAGAKAQAAAPSAAGAVPLASTADTGDVPEPPPAPKPQAVSADLPRMAKADAEARRARLIESLSDTLSTSEAAR